ncbi:MAG: polysaccharide biosynthesis protein GtrA [Lachnospiraceae bacterium]
MKGIREWIRRHPAIWEFILFNVLSNVATVTNFVVMWVCTGFVFASLNRIPFQFLIFNYMNVESDLGLCGFLSFLVATSCAQAINFYVQKNYVFRSNAAFSQAIPKYISLAVFLVIVSAALPAYSQTLFVRLGVPQEITPTLANLVNILVQVAISYPAMKFWIMTQGSISPVDKSRSDVLSDSKEGNL